ncbi:hypothetical protein BD410DRAFT_444410 [Rickenella mellea]|uniref:Uncharacterized protein n=1 Tax=Rickenella mellea TaxID=50990 RepID=A0A4Y7PXN8_9AGAM|nr:hypothetical protein BD410DRAFT_444410 [Rickenella mellea]
MKLTESSTRVEQFLHQQVHRPFFKRYVRRGEILRGIGICDTELSYALSLFSIRTLNQLQAAEARRQADKEKIMAALIPPSTASPDTTPRHHTPTLPTVSPPTEAYEVPSTTPCTPSNVPPKPKCCVTTAAKVQSDIQSIVEQQNVLDNALDVHDLRQFMCIALVTSKMRIYCVLCKFRGRGVEEAPEGAGWAGSRQC